MIEFLIILLIAFGILTIILEVMNYNVKQEIKELEKNRSKKRIYKKQEIELYEIFCEALNKGVEIDFSGIKCKMIGFNQFSADGEIYRLNIENFLKVLKGE